MILKVTNDKSMKNVQKKKLSVNDLGLDLSDQFASKESLSKEG